MSRLRLRYLTAILPTLFIIHCPAIVAQEADTLLAVAARDGDLNETKHLLESGVDPNRGMDEWTPLMLAAMNGNLEIARLLLEKGADPHRMNGDYGSALGVAAMTPFTPSDDETSLVLLFLEKGMQVDAGNGASMTPLMFAAREGKAKTMQVLIDHGATVNWRDARGWSPLMFAARSGNPEAVILLLDQDADPNILTDYPQRTPIHYSVDADDYEATELLLKAGANPDGLYSGGEAMPPLLSAASMNNTRMVELLLRYDANPNYSDQGYLDTSEDYRMRTPLDWAVDHNNKEMAEMLRKGGALNHKDFEARYVQMRKAVQEGKAKEFDKLMKERIDPRLFVSSEDEYVDLVEAIVKSGQNEMLESVLKRWPINQYRAQDLYEAALTENNEEAIAVLKKYNPDALLSLAIYEGFMMLAEDLLTSDGSLANKPADDGEIPLAVAVSTGNEEMIHLLLNAGADPSLPGRWGEIPLFEAIRAGDGTIVEMMLEVYPEGIHSRDNSGMTPLSTAARGGSSHLFDLLLKRGASIESGDNWGWRPLHHAAWMGDVEAVETLLALGADPSARVLTGEDAMELAEIADNPRVMELLQ